MPKFTLLTYSKARTEIQVVRPVPGSDKRASYRVASLSTNQEKRNLGISRLAMPELPAAWLSPINPRK